MDKVRAWVRARRQRLARVVLEEKKWFFFPVLAVLIIVILILLHVARYQQTEFIYNLF